MTKCEVVDYLTSMDKDMACTILNALCMYLKSTREEIHQFNDSMDAAMAAGCVLPGDAEKAEDLLFKLQEIKRAMMYVGYHVK